MGRQTPLHEFHQTHGKTVEFAGYDMPIWYTSTIQEHMAVRNHSGVFDVSHMGRLDITGPDAATFVDALLPTDVAKQPNGKSVYTLLLNDDAGIIDDLIVLKAEDGEYTLVVNAACKDKDLGHMQKVGAGLDFQIRDKTEQTTMIAVQGPEAVNALQPLTPLPLAEMKRFTHVLTRVGRIESVVARTGYTGEDGFEIIVHDAEVGARDIWEALIKNDAQPCGLGARDSLRLEAGLPLYGSDMDERTNPFQADLGWVISKEKENYVGRERLASISKHGPDKVRRGIIIDERIPRSGFRVVDASNSEIGVVTSGTFSPVLKKGIAMAYVDVQSSQPGQAVRIIVRDAPSSGKIVRFPFYDDSRYGWKRKSPQQ